MVVAAFRLDLCACTMAQADTPAPDPGPTLFCLEVYVHKVERLSAKFRRNPPAFAIRFLDYAPIILAPPQGAANLSASGAMWYGKGKRCLLEERTQVLEKCLRTRADAALLVLAIESSPSRKRKLYGSGTVSLADFHDHHAEPLGAVHTWGRLECCTAITNPYAKTVGVATLSVTLASFDPALRALLAPTPKQSEEKSVSAHFESCISDPPSDPAPSSHQSTLPHSPQAVDIAVAASQSPTLRERQTHTNDNTLRLDTGTDRPRPSQMALSPTPPTPLPSALQHDVEKASATHCAEQDQCMLSPSAGSLAAPSLMQRSANGGNDHTLTAEHCVDTTLRMPQVSVDGFDTVKRNALISSLAQCAAVRPESAQLLSCREGSLIVDARIRFAEDKQAAVAFAEQLEFAPMASLVPYDLFGPFEVLDVTVRRCKRISPGTTKSSTPPAVPFHQPVPRVSIDRRSPGHTREGSPNSGSWHENNPRVTLEDSWVTAVTKGPESLHNNEAVEASPCDDSACEDGGSSDAEQNTPTGSDHHIESPNTSGAQQRQAQSRLVSSRARTLTVFRGEAVLIDDDDCLGECAPPLFLDARDQSRRRKDSLSNEHERARSSVLTPSHTERGDGRIPNKGSIGKTSTTRGSPSQKCKHRREDQVDKAGYPQMHRPPPQHVGTQPGFARTRALLRERNQTSAYYKSAVASEHSNICKRHSTGRDQNRTATKKASIACLRDDNLLEGFPSAGSKARGPVPINAPDIDLEKTVRDPTRLGSIHELGGPPRPSSNVKLGENALHRIQRSPRL